MHSVLAADFGTQLSNSFGHAVDVLFAFIPALIGALIILLIGVIVARVVRAIIVRLLGAVHFDQIMQRTGIPGLLERGGVRTDIAGFVAGLIYWFIFLIFLVAAANALGVPTITAIVTSIVLFLPNVLVAVVILIIGSLIANFVSGIVRSSMTTTNIKGSGLIAGLVRYAILAFVVIMALDQIGVGAAIVQTLFACVAGGLTLALAIAFGFGGRDTAKDIVDSAYTSLSGRRPANSGELPPPLR